MNLLGTARLIVCELSGMLRLAADASSFLRYATDIFLCRMLRLADVPLRDRERSVRLRGDIRLTYRLNRGDLQSFREVWIEEAYRLPFPITPCVIVDLGANIGLASVWLAKRYGCSWIIAVEPCAANARLVRRNMADNDLPGEVVEAAVGPIDGAVLFEEHRHSNLGRVGSNGRRVPGVSMVSLLQSLPADSPVDLIKMDIEGSEQALLEGDLRWLEGVHSIVAEFHPTMVDYPQLIATLGKAGFRHIGDARIPGYADTFVRPAPGRTR